MTNKEEALRMALEALEEAYHSVGRYKDWEQITEAVEALRQAIEQAEKQEPAAWRYNGKLHEFDPSDWATGPVTPLYTSPPAKPWVNPSLKEYEDIMLANMTPKNLDEREAVIGALNDMVVLLEEKNK